MSIKVENITKLYGRQKALDDVSFSIASGEIVGLLGPNGAGKSTLMKIITCFIPPESGNVQVHGFNIFDDSFEVRKRIGYLPEHNPLYNDMYVKEYLEFHAGIHNVPNSKKRIMEMMELTGLTTERRKKLRELSKGYRQRAGLAQALLHDPDVLIMDEPTSGLDPNQLIEIRNLIREAGKEKTVMLSTHIMQEVEAICDRVVIIDKGRIVADDTASNLSKMASGKEIIIVEFSSPVNIEDLESIEGVLGVRKESDQLYYVEATEERDTRQDIFDLAVKRNTRVLSLQRKEYKLEEIFRQLTMK